MVQTINFAIKSSIKKPSKGKKIKSRKEGGPDFS
ncbi:unnamed protein product [Spirodela intermedia]|uniref:Uncharacterized protein n=1 Tax=Spirodela intermedia TaxID=51605 RepID=A0A7I8JSU0_SPIIN|nr:unnamed protein product [Spirodela intermedia]CAA6672825.1 unnamed protein product [Spirodela intermedia]